jgi:dynein light intermediate chain, axonemal
MEGDFAPASLLQYEGALPINQAGAASPTSRKSGKATSSSGNTQLDEILNAILPPRTFQTPDGGNFMQYVVKQPSTRMDVIHLQEELDKKLLERQAREMGICPVREDLYSQGFDELIRQVTLNGAERGLLLLRVRDEVRMTVDAYKTLYDSSVTFGVRKQLQAEQGMSEMEGKISALQDTKKNLENQVLELRNKVEVVEKREQERRQLDEKKRQDEIAFLRYQAQNLDQFLKSITGGK